MKNLLRRFILSTLLTFIITSIYVTIQYFYQRSHQDGMFISLGFPYRFYYFTPSFEMHGLIRKHLIYDAFSLFLFTFLISVIIGNRRNRKNTADE
jgi:hypothetical protein